MKNGSVTTCNATYVLSAVILVAAVLAASPSAAKIKKGALVLRSGQVNDAASYKNEHTDSNDKLLHVSALCSPGASTKSKSADLIATDRTRGTSGLFANMYGATQASTIMSAGGTIESKPLKNNPNHCEISGLSVAKIKGVWSMWTLAGGC